MRILEVNELTIPDIFIIKFGRFNDHRGFFSEHYRKSVLNGHKKTSFFEEHPFVQANESLSKKGVVRGLHFQWNPYMGKLVRTVTGHMIDIVLDIRKDSPTLGKALLYDMPGSMEKEYSEWIWVPPGFAHGNIFLKDTVIEYFCTGEYSQGNEAGICPFAEDVDWSMADKKLVRRFKSMEDKCIITDKDRDGMSVEEWLEDERSDNFIYEKLISL